MYNPALHALSVQRAALFGWLRASQAVTESWMALLAQNSETLQEHLHRRAEDWHKHPFMLPHGACWTDLYGHRAHDIDVEHDV